MLSKQNSAYVVPNYIQNKLMETYDTNKYEEGILTKQLFKLINRQFKLQLLK